ncbi:hypothetical protein [Streptomyces sp. NPDC048669]|uniref:hypothetical protein n=1 Tax=Streptomyces sp. NPDC048669 TaxID=3155267 RepID=UPI0034125393
MAAWLYVRWSAKGTMVVYAALTVGALLVLATVGTDGSRPVLLTTVMLLFVGTAGVIALIGPHTAEIALILSMPGGVRTAAVLVAVPMAVAGVAVAARGTTTPHAVAQPSLGAAATLDVELDDLVRSEAGSARPTTPLPGKGAR